MAPLAPAGPRRTRSRLPGEPRALRVDGRVTIRHAGAASSTRRPGDVRPRAGRRRPRRRLARAGRCRSWSAMRAACCTDSGSGRRRWTVRRARAGRPLGPRRRPATRRSPTRWTSWRRARLRSAPRGLPGAERDVSVAGRRSRGRRSAWQPVGARPGGRLARAPSPSSAGPHAPVETSRPRRLAADVGDPGLPGPRRRRPVRRRTILSFAPQRSADWPSARPDRGQRRASSRRRRASVGDTIGLTIGGVRRDVLVPPASARSRPPSRPIASPSWTWPTLALLRFEGSDASTARRMVAVRRRRIERGGRVEP